MNQRLAQIALLVEDYDEAIRYYTTRLGFILLEDTKMSETKRWVVVSPPGDGGCRLLLANASNERQQAAIGNQAGGRVFLFLYTDHFWRDYDRMVLHDIEFIEKPRDEPYGTVVVFKDLYGNLWDFIEPRQQK